MDTSDLPAQPPLDRRDQRLRGAQRVVAALLALFWLGAGATGIMLGVRARAWPLALLSLAAAWYGMAWLFVTVRARTLAWREFLTPWRGGR